MRDPKDELLVQLARTVEVLAYAYSKEHPTRAMLAGLPEQIGRLGGALDVVERSES